MRTSHNKVHQKMGKSDREDTAICKKVGENEACPSSVAVNEMPRVDIFFLSLGYCGIFSLILLMSASVLPAQLEAMVGQASKGRWLGGLGFGGAVIQCITGPVVGSISDRLSTPYGRRRPIMAAAAVLVVIAVFGMALSAPTLKGVTFDDGLSVNNCSVDLEAKRCEPYYNTSHSMHLVPKPPASAIASSEKHTDQLYLQLDRQLGNTSIELYVVFFLLTSLGLATLTTAYNALLADKTTEHSRGYISGIMGFMTLLGNITGAALGTLVSRLGVPMVFVIILSFFALTVILTITFTPEVTSNQFHVSTDGLDVKEVFVAFVEPLKEHNFRWVCITRFLLQLGLNTVLGFMQYWIADVVGTPRCWSPVKAMGVMLVPLLLLAALSSLIFGYVSDVIERRIPILVTSQLVMACLTGLMPYNYGDHSFILAMVVGMLFGLSVGAYVSVDFALVMDVLPAAKDKAKDLAVWNLALILPQALSVPIGGILLDVFQKVNCSIALGYIVVFSVASFYFFLSVVFTFKIRGIK